MAARKLLSMCLLALTAIAQQGGKQAREKAIYENYSFDFSAHTRPIAYRTLGNTLELNNKVKLNPAVPNRGGAYVFDKQITDKDFEIEMEFTLQSQINLSRGFMLLLTQHEVLEEEIEASPIGYRQNYEGAAVYVFRNPTKNNVWQVMLVQNAGVRQALRQENQMYSALRNGNHCQFEFSMGERAGIRISLVDKVWKTQVMDSGDVSYRDCAQQALLGKNWVNHYFSVIAKNTPNERNEMMVTDLDIDLIQVSSLRPWSMPTPEEQAEERNKFLIARHSTQEDGETVFDVSRLFELNLAHDLAKEQKKQIDFINDDDLFDDYIYKHHQMLKRVEHNFIRFNEQLQEEIRDEEEYERDLISSTSLVETHHQLEELYKTADQLKENLNIVLNQSRVTLDQVVSSENL